MTRSEIQALINAAPVTFVAGGVRIEIPNHDSALLSPDGSTMAAWDINRTFHLVDTKHLAVIAREPAGPNATG